jgi:ATP-dependent Lon protease
MELSRNERLRLLAEAREKARMDEEDWKWTIEHEITTRVEKEIKARVEKEIKAQVEKEIKAKVEKEMKAEGKAEIIKEMLKVNVPDGMVWLTAQNSGFTKEQYEQLKQELGVRN